MKHKKILSWAALLGLLLEAVSGAAAAPACGDGVCEQQTVHLLVGEAKTVAHNGQRFALRLESVFSSAAGEKALLAVNGQRFQVSARRAYTLAGLPVHVVLVHRYPEDSSGGVNSVVLWVGSENPATCRRDCYNACTDSDGGFNDSERGYAASGAFGAFDCCVDPATNRCLYNRDMRWLSENLCNGTALETRRIECPNGCLNGACLAERRFRTEKLAVSGTRIVRERDGVPVALYGASTADAAAWDRDAGLDALKENLAFMARWGMNIVRLPIHPGFWRQTGPEKQLDYIRQVAAWADELGMYVIVDWHGVGNVVTGQTTDNKMYQTTLEETRDFWQRVSARFRDTPNLLYDIFNEPDWITWPEWKHAAETIIHDIRSQGDTRIVLVGGLLKAYDLREAVADPVQAENVAYGVHPWPSKAQWVPWEDAFGAPSQALPVLVTEWGYQEDGPPGIQGTYEGYGYPLLAYLQEKGLSWLAWVWYPTWRPPLVRDWDTGSPTAFGEKVRCFFENQLAPCPPPSANVTGNSKKKIGERGKKPPAVKPAPAPPKKRFKSFKTARPSTRTVRRPVQWRPTPRGWEKQEKPVVRLFSRALQRLCTAPAR